MDQLLLHLPLRETPAAYVEGVPQLLDFVNLLDHVDDPAFWSKTRRPLDFTNMDVAMLHLSGWDAKQCDRRGGFRAGSQFGSLWSGGNQQALV
jgi:predicted acyl esterase